MQTITGKRKRAIGDIDDPTPDELYSGIIKVPEPIRSYLALLYLTGNRVSEVLGTPYKEKQRNNPSDFLIEPAKKNSLEIEGNMIRLKVRTLKRKGRPQHRYVCRIDKPEEQRYFELINNHLQTLQPTDYIWNFSRFKAWRHCNKATGLPPHKLRGLRATRDAIVFELDAIDLKNKFNWGGTDMAFKYAAKSTHNIEDKLNRK